jgi:hypothetical protein
MTIMRIRSVPTRKNFVGAALPRCIENFEIQYEATQSFALTANQHEIDGNRHCSLASRCAGLTAGHQIHSTICSVLFQNELAIVGGGLWDGRGWREV